MRIAVDLGNRNVKICYRLGGKLTFDIFQSRYSTEEQIDYSTLEVVELNGVKYLIEQGTYDNEFNKTEKDYLPLLLCALARACGDDKSDIKVELMIGAPAEHILGLRERFKEQLQGKSFEFKYKDKVKKVKIEKLGVIGEGFATWFSIPRSIKSSINNIGILDIGGRTTNVITFIMGKQHIVCSLNNGMLDVKNDILKEKKREGKDYDINTIENLIDNGRIKISDDLKENLIKSIINGMKLYKIDKDLFEWNVTGGGSLDIGEALLDKYFGKDCTLENAVYSNVAGKHAFMEAKWGD